MPQITRTTTDSIRANLSNPWKALFFILQSIIYILIVISIPFLHYFFTELQFFKVDQ